MPPKRNVFGFLIRRRPAVRVWIIGLIGLLGHAAFVGAADPPDWVGGSSKKHPAAGYLTGVGYGDTRQAAEDRAYAAISKIFKAEIDSKTQEWEKYLQSDAKGQTDSRRQVGIEQATSVSTQKVLENVAIAETWLDESKAVYYALAVMDRPHAAATLRDRITSLDLKVDELLKESRESDNKLRTVQSLHAAIQNLLLREAYNTELRIIDPAGKGSEGMVNLAAVGRDLRQYLAKNFKIVVEVAGPHHERIRAAIVEGLNRQGFPVAPVGREPVERDADLVIKGVVAFEPVEMPGGGSKRTRFVRWSAAFDLTDQSSKRVIGSVAQQGREGHLTSSEAESRALRVAEQAMAEEISRRIAEFIYGQEKTS